MINAFFYLFEGLIRNLGGPIGRFVRIKYYRSKFKSCGLNCIIEEGVHIINPKLITLGNKVWIDKNTILLAGKFEPQGRQFIEKGNKTIKWGELIIHDNCHIAPFSMIQAHGGVIIGKNVTLAAGARVFSLSHHYRNLNNDLDDKRYSFSSMAPIEDQFLIVGNVIIGENAAVGLNSVILPGTNIPNSAWIGVLVSPSSKDSLSENIIIRYRGFIVVLMLLFNSISRIILFF